MLTKGSDEILRDVPTAEVFAYVEHLKSNNRALLQANLELTKTNSVLERKLSEAGFINEVFANLIERSNLKETISSILNGALQITRSEAGFIFLHNRKKEAMELMLTKGDLPVVVKDHVCKMYSSSGGLSLYEGAGTQFDPWMVKKFLAMNQN